MSIKLSIKDLKDLLKIQKKQIKKRKRNKKRLTKAQPNNIRSSSDHMISHGITMTNTANESTELIRLQRQALEDKLKADKEKEKADKEKKTETESQIIPFGNRSGSNDLRNEINDIHKTLNFMMIMPGSIQMPDQGRAPPSQQNNNVGYVDDGPTIEEVTASEGLIEEPKKDAAVEETEQMFDPDNLDINKAENKQLIGWINTKRGGTDASFIKMNKVQLQRIANTIVAKGDVEGEIAEAQAEIRTKEREKRLAKKAKEDEEAKKAKDEEEAKAQAKAKRAEAKAKKAREELEAKKDEEDAEAKKAEELKTKKDEEEAKKAGGFTQPKKLAPKKAEAKPKKERFV